MIQRLLELAAFPQRGRSHAPYTGNRAGVALALELGTGAELCWGAAIENVAFNPGMPPLHVALVAGLAAAARKRAQQGGDTSALGVVSPRHVFDAVRAVVLVQPTGSTSWVERTQIMLAAAAPAASLVRILHRYGTRRGCRPIVTPHSRREPYHENTL